MMPEFLRRLRYYFRRREFEADLAEEMQHHASLSGQKQFGNTTLFKERSRAMWSWTTIEAILQDLRYGARQLRLSPGFAAAAILSLALGAGANIAVFELLNAVRLRSLPVRNPQELAEIRIPGGNQGFGRNFGWNALTYPLWEQIRDHNEAFASLLAWAPADLQVGEGEAQQTVGGAWVSGSAFPTLGVTAERGHLFAAEDDRPGCAGEAVISHGFWQRHFGGSDAALGSRLLVSEKPVTVIGVMPREFFGLEVGANVDVALPFCAMALWDAERLQQRNAFWLGAMGRLKPGWTIERAARQLKAASAPWFAAVAPTGYSDASMQVWDRFRLTAEARPKGTSRLRREYEASLWLLLGITALVLLIACANLANLMLARASARARELAVRMAIGASRLRVITQLLWESLLIAGAGAATGAGLAVVLSRGLVRFLSTRQNVIQLDLTPDWRVLVFIAAVAAGACLCFGLSTAIYATRARAIAKAGAGTRGTTADRRRFSFQRILIAAQVAICLVLVVSSLLFVRSFRNLFTLDAGFRQQGVVFHYLDFEPLAPSREEAAGLLQDVLAKFRAIPGLESVATTTHVPLSGQSWGHAVRFPASDKKGDSHFTWVSPQYFATMEIPILAGRDFSASDTSTSPRVVLVNEAFVKRYFDGANPIGKTVRSLGEPDYPETLWEIAGIVRDTKYSDLRQDAIPIAYAPDSQFPAPRTGAAIVTRSSLPAGSVMKSVREAVAQVNPGIRLNASIDFRAQVVDRLARERMLAWLAGFFGALAAVLAAIGLYGVVSYMVAGRRGEIGIRIALGATRGSVMWMIVRQMAIVLAIGMMAGIAGTLALSGAVQTLLFEMKPDDPLTLALAAAALAAIAGLASLVPARRASRIDPMEALRTE